MPDIPDTESTTIATLAIAWEIVKISCGTAQRANKSGDEGIKQLTNALIKVTSAIHNNKAIE